jgi:replication factor C subunit 3/5
LALQDIITEIHDLIGTYEFPSAMRLYILENLSEIEFRLAEGGNEQIQLGALIGTFKLATEKAN